MKQVVFSVKAMSDLVSIRVYTEKTWSHLQSLKYRDLLLDECYSLPIKEEFMSFKLYKNYYYSHCGHHYLFFRSSESDIKIVRILHERQNFALHLDE